MTIKDLITVLDENEQLSVKMNALHNKKEWEKQDINLMEMEVKKIRTDSCSMIFAEVDLGD